MIRLSWSLFVGGLAGIMTLVVVFSLFILLGVPTVVDIWLAIGFSVLVAIRCFITEWKESGL